MAHLTMLEALAAKAIVVIAVGPVLVPHSDAYACSQFGIRAREGQRRGCTGTETATRLRTLSCARVAMGAGLEGHRRHVHQSTARSSRGESATLAEV